MKVHLMVIAVGMLLSTAGIAQAASTSVGPGMTTGSARLSPAQRAAIVDQIVRKWGPFVQQVYKANPGSWSRRMQATFAATNDSNLQHAAGMKTFQGMMGALTGQHLSDAQVEDSLATQAQVLGSGPVKALLGSATADLVYTPLAPCRIADTRNVGGTIAGGTSRDFRGYTTTDFAFQGGIAGSDCGIPANPAALMINVAAPVSSQSGYLTVWPFGTTRPLASNLDYKAGDLANNEIAAKMTIGSPTAEFSVYAHGTTNVVVDVVGYFMAPEATALDCLNVPATVHVAGSADMHANADCPVNYAATGGGCDSKSTTQGSFGTIDNIATGISSFQCEFHNTTGTKATAIVTARCCRVPGR